MKRQITIILFFLTSYLCHSQGEWNNFIFGKHAGVNFNSGVPVPITTVNLAYLADYSTITTSDSLGNLLFYAGPVSSPKVYNRNNVPMPNGLLYSGSNNYSLQPYFVVQDINDHFIYYLFVALVQSVSSDGLFYSVIDMRLDGGLGDIVAGEKMIPVPNGGNAGLVITGTRHHNNHDAWIVTRNRNNSYKYLSYLITSSGINPVPVQSQSSIFVSNAYIGGVDFMRISPDGNKLICIYDSSAEYCSFNSKTGVITPLFQFNCVSNNEFFANCGAEWSVDNKFLYITSQSQQANPYNLFQFDATKTDSTQFVQSKILIGHTILPTQIQRGPDNKIYLPVCSKDSLSVIHSPQIQGLGCNFQQDGVCLLASNLAYSGLPQFLQRYKTYFHHQGFCQNSQIEFSGDIWPPADTIRWNFGDPSSGTNNISTLADPSHIYSSPGIYFVELYVRHIDNRTDTSWQSITIFASPQVALGPDRTICTGNTTTFDAGSCSGCTYEWKDISTGMIVGMNQTFTTGIAGSYCVKVTNGNNCSGYDTVQVATTPTPQVTNNPLNDAICSGQFTNIFLSSNVPGTTFHWTASLTSGNITGYSADSGLVINQVLTNSLTTAGIVTYHITPIIGSCAGNTVDFSVTVVPGDSVKISISASINNICAGTSVTFTATPDNPGATPVYQWKVNGNNAGGNSTSYSFTPADNDVVTCVLLSSNTVCVSNNPATSNSITMVVNPLQPVSLTIAPSQNPVCAGKSVTFTATPVNEGFTPQYQWNVNGLNVGTNSPTYTYNPSDGDEVICVLNSSIACPVSNPVTSNTVTMIQNISLPAGITINASQNPFCPGSSISFLATPFNGGPNPTYQWKVNGNNAGTNSNTYIYNPMDGDSVRCILLSDLNCVTNNPVSSSKIIMSGALAPVVTFTACFDTITTVNAKPIKLKGGIPLNGIYSGAGVAADIFYPALAGVGNHLITYTYTNSAFCSANAHVRIVTLNASPVTCGNPVTDVRDNQTYPTVQIGTQCWMAANLNYGRMIQGNQHQRDNCVPEKYCYSNDPALCTLHFALYQWDELMRYDSSPASQGLCPPGWHVPTETEWNTLFSNWTNNAFAGAPLKYSGFSGFNALLSGVGHQNVHWDFTSFATFFWSSTAYGAFKAWAHGMNDYDPSVSLYPSFRSNAFSVRCLHD